MEVSKRKGVSTMCIKKSLLFVMYFVYDHKIDKTQGHL